MNGSEKNITLLFTLVIIRRSHRIAYMCVIWLKRYFRDIVGLGIILFFPLFQNQKLINAFRQTFFLCMLCNLKCIFLAELLSGIK